MTETIDNLIAALKLAKQRSGLGCAQIANAMGITVSRVYKIEEDYGALRLSTFIRYAKALGYNLKVTLEKSQ